MAENDMKIRLVKYYDRYGKSIDENDLENLAYITFQVCKGDEPQVGDVFIQVTKKEGLPVIVSTYLIEKYGYGGYGKPKDLDSLDKVKDYGVPENIISEIKEICKSKGVDWL